MFISNWNKEKAKKILNLLDLEQWGKTFSIGVRLFLIVVFILSIVFGAGYWYSLKKRPVVPVDFSAYLADGKVVRARLNGDWLQISKHGMAVTDAEGNVKKTIKVEDIPILTEKYKPYGLELNLIGYYGVGFGEKIGAEAGGGVEVFRLWDVNCGIIATNKAGYLTISYPLKKAFIFELQNTAIVGATGYNYDGDRQHSIGMRVRF